MYLWLPFGYLVLFFSNHFVCICFFVGVYHQWFIHLETYTYERGNFFNWYPSLFESPCLLPLILWWCQKEIIPWVLVLFSICIFMHSLLFEDPWLHAYHGKHVDFYWLYMFLLAFGFFNWLLFPIGILELVNILFIQRSSLCRGWASLMLNPLIWYLIMAQPYLWCKCYVLCAMCYVLFYALLHLLYVLDDFGGVRIPFLCTRL